MNTSFVTAVRAAVERHEDHCFADATAIGPAGIKAIIAAGGDPNIYPQPCTCNPVGISLSLRDAILAELEGYAAVEERAAGIIGSDYRNAGVVAVAFDHLTERLAAAELRVRRLETHGKASEKACSEVEARLERIERAGTALRVDVIEAEGALGEFLEWSDSLDAPTDSDVERVLAAVNANAARRKLVVSGREWDEAVKP